MRSFFLYNLEVFLCLGVFYLFYHFSLNKETNHQFVRAYLVSALLISFVIPFAQLNAFSSNISEIVPTFTIPEFSVYAGKPDTSIVVVNSDTRIYWTLFYSITCIILLIGFIKEFLKIAKIQKTHQTKVEYFEGYKVIIHRTKFPTFSFIKTIYLSGDDIDPANSKHKILLHELSHIKGAHSIDVIFIELLRIFFWFNPMVYLFKNALILSHEYIADQYSVTKGDQQNYVNLLVNQTLSNLGLSLGSHFGRKSGILSKWPWARSFSFNKSQTLKRIKMIKSRRKMNKLKYLIPVFAIAVATIIVSCVEDDNLSEIEEEASAIKVSSTELEIEDANEIFSIVEEKPLFPGGDAAMFRYLGKNIEYPLSARNNKIQGRVFVQFIVNEDGSLSDIKVIKGLSEELNNGAVRVVSEMPLWTAGRQRGKEVNVRMVLPIYFKLHGEDFDGDSQNHTIELEVEGELMDGLAVTSYK